METPQSPEPDDVSIAPLYSEVPPRERKLLPGLWRFLVMMATAASFGGSNVIPAWVSCSWL